MESPKRALLAMAWGYREQYGMSIIYLIPVNVYGPRDNTDPEMSHVIPALGPQVCGGEGTW